MDKPIAKHFLVSGKVQGVWFRAFTQKAAQSLNITGWVKNLPNGSVEVMAYGTDAQLKTFQAHLEKGPKNARVDEVTVKEQPWLEVSEFIIR